MVKCGSLMKSALVAAVLLAVIRFGSADKLAKCCTTVSKAPINEPMTGYMVQKPHEPCVPAVIIQTESGVYCVHIKAHWLKRKITEYERTKREATTKPAVFSSTASVLPTITSTAPPATTTPVAPSSTVSLLPTITSAAPAATTTPVAPSSTVSLLPTITSTAPAATTTPVAPSSTVSLLSIITSTASPASTSASFPTATSFPPTSQTPADETFEENNSK